jgi:biopolymer transport protein ExbD
MAIQTGSHATGTLAEINVTPLVDVMLVLLIVFMVTAPMSQKGAEVTLPAAKAKTIPDDQGMLVVTLTKEHTVFIGKMLVPSDQVEAVLKKNAKLQSDGEAYIHADQSLPFSDVMSIVSAMQAGGAQKIGFITDPLK